jgi:hypothetical protein
MDEKTVSIVEEGLNSELKEDIEHTLKSNLKE